MFNIIYACLPNPQLLAHIFECLRAKLILSSLT